MASGAPALHVIDLDAALGRGGNGDLLEALLGIAQVPVQVGGGVRSRADVERWSRAGATRVVVGTRAVRDPEWLAAIVASHPDFVVLAADVRAGLVVVDGWQSDTRSSPSDLLRACEDLALAAVLVTDVGREGTLSGVDVELFETLAAKTRHPLIAAGSITPWTIWTACRRRVLQRPLSARPCTPARLASNNCVELTGDDDDKPQDERDRHRADTWSVRQHCRR